MRPTTEQRLIDAFHAQLGPTIREALYCPTVIEVMVNDCGRVRLDTIDRGRIETAYHMPTGAAEAIIRLIAHHIGETVSEDRPLVAGTTPLTGERFQGVLPPLAKAPTFAIRKRPSIVFRLDDYVADGIMTAAQAETLRRALADRQNIVVSGDTLSGKTTLLNALLAEPAIADNRVVLIEDTIELQCSARDQVQLLTTHAVGGHYVRLGDPESMTLQPLADIHRRGERTFAQEWLANILNQEGLTLRPKRREAIWSALGSLLTFPKEQRTLTVLTSLVQDHEIRKALGAFTLEGPYGALLDATSSSWSEATWQCFDMETLTELPGAIAPTLLAIFHRLEQDFRGEPTLLILDEAWLFLDHSLFAAQIKTWLKTLRKKNVSVLLATQSLADIEQSSIAATIIDSCPQRIFLPNERARESLLEGFYQRFGLNERQIDLIAEATPKSDYYMVSPRGNRLFSLTLGQIATAFCGASTPDDHKLMDPLLGQQAAEPFAMQWLEAKGLLEATEALRQVEPPRRATPILLEA